MANKTTWVFNRVVDVLKLDLLLKIQLGKKAREEGVVEDAQFSA